MVEENPLWHNHAIANNRHQEFPISLTTHMVRRQNPPLIGPDDDQRQWHEILVCLSIGGQTLGPGVRFPAHEPLSPNVALAAVLGQMLAASEPYELTIKDNPHNPREGNMELARYVRWNEAHGIPNPSYGSDT